MTTTDLSRAVWRKSVHSGGNGGCSELARVRGIVAVRDSKNPKGPVLIFATDIMRGFVAEVKEGKYDL